MVPFSTTPMRLSPVPLLFRIYWYWGESRGGDEVLVPANRE